jgi:hypothetical protein
LGGAGLLVLQSVSPEKAIQWLAPAVEVLELMTVLKFLDSKGGIEMGARSHQRD